MSAHLGWIQCTQCGWGCEVTRAEVDAGDYHDGQACGSCGIGPCRIDWMGHINLREENERLRREIEALRDVLIDLRSDMRELAERDHPIARVVYERMCEELGSDTHRDPGPTEEPKREYIVHATVEKRVRLELLADDDQEALDDAAHVALYDDTLDVLDEQVTDTSIVWRGRDKGGEDV